MSQFPDVVRNRWIVLRWGSAVRRFLKIEISATDGSVYLILGTSRRNARIHRVEVTVPAGHESASVDYTSFPANTFEEFKGHHVGYKASGRVISRYGDQHQPHPRDVPAIVDRPVLLETIYPAPHDDWPECVPRPRDLVAPEHCDYRAASGDTVEALFGSDPFHVEVWQLPLHTLDVTVGPTVVGVLTIRAGTRELFVAFIQDEVDRQRGWLPGGTRVIRPAGSASEPL